MCVCVPIYNVNNHPVIIQFVFYVFLLLAWCRDIDTISFIIVVVYFLFYFAFKLSKMSDSEEDYVELEELVKMTNDRMEEQAELTDDYVELAEECGRELVKDVEEDQDIDEVTKPALGMEACFSSVCVVCVYLFIYFSLR